MSKKRKERTLQQIVDRLQSRLKTIKAEQQEIEFTINSINTIKQHELKIKELKREQNRLIGKIFSLLKKYGE